MVITLKIRKVTLKAYDGDNHEWVGIYPRTSGDRVVGQVPDSAKLGGQPPSAFMPAYSDGAPVRILKSDGKSTQGLSCGKLVVSDNPLTDEKRVGAGDAYFAGKLYAQNGRQVATLYDVSTTVSQIESAVVNSKVSAATTADRLTTPVTINGVKFDGSQSISTPVFICSSTPPADITKFWVDDDHVLNFYANGKWNQIVGAWGV